MIRVIFLSLVDRFLYKLFFMSFLLLSVIALDKVGIIEFEELQTKLSDHVNVLKLMTSINGKLKLFVLDLDDEVSVGGEILKTEQIANAHRVDLGTYEAVENLSLGVVVRIDKNNIYILDQNDYLYCYKNLESVDVSMYEIIKKNHIIGKANSKENGNYYDVVITRNGEIIPFIP